MHGDSSFASLDEITDIVEFFLKKLLPTNPADRMGSKGNQIGSDSEEE
jgi:hypothetical protein